MHSQTIHADPMVVLLTELEVQRALADDPASSDDVSDTAAQRYADLYGLILVTPATTPAGKLMAREQAFAEMARDRKTGMPPDGMTLWKLLGC